MFITIVGILGYFYYVSRLHTDAPSPLSPLSIIREKPLEKYSIKRLQTREPQGSEIVFGEIEATTSAYIVQHFHFFTEGKKVTGFAHIPNNGKNKHPVVAQYRGYVDREIYETGYGTRRSAEVYASNGFLSLAPDFLGYGNSDNPSEQIFEERFQTYTTALDFFDSIQMIPFADEDNIFFWGHSNGGHIALTVLEILGRDDIPTTLWAPVTKPFPYSILFYTDELSDRGKFLRRELAKFEEEYDVDKYSLTEFVEYIQSPLMIHQGGRDEAVPQKWSDEFVALLDEYEKDVVYHVYPSADHNMVGPPTGGWNKVVSRDIEFFRKHLE